jgi:glutamate-1-semialdehyde 2,1-aminomutase
MGRQYQRSRDLQGRFRRLIPGGAHTYAKGDDQFPESMPIYIERGAGGRVWDVDGNEYIEFGSGLRSVTLGHAYPPVVQAATAQLAHGSNFVRPHPIELQCAESLHTLIPGAEMVKFAKHGSDATSAAIKLARAHTGRERIAICADHPFFSVDDWFIGSTPMAAGIPEAVRGLTVGFRYNDLESVRRLFAEYPRQIACVILEPERTQPPAEGYLQGLQQLCRQEGAVLVFDEMITGFRWHNGGAQAFYGVVPDLSTFGKGIANGFSVSALVGRAELMQLGGLEHERERVFLLSTTHGAETHALAAALETMSIFRKEPVVETLWRQGARLARGIQSAVAALRLEDFFTISGRPCCLIYGTNDGEKKPSQPFRTLFLQETMRRGLLAPSFVVNYSHGDQEIDQTIEIVAEALRIYAQALDGGIEKFLEGRPVKPVFRRWN